MKKIKYLLFILILSACGGSSDDGTPTGSSSIAPATAVTVTDVANFGDARDMEVFFTPPANTNAIAQYRGIIVPASKSDALDAVEASGLDASRYALILGSTSPIFRFTASTLDFEGNAIQEGTAYQVYILSVAQSGDVENALSIPSDAITLEQKSAIYTLANLPTAGSGGMDVDAQGNIYMADFGGTLSGSPWGTRVYKITPSGDVSIFASGLLGASGNDFDADGNLYQSSIAGGTISKISPGGQVTTLATGLSGPVGIAVLDNGSLLVCNCGNNTIGLVTQAGNVSTYSTSSLFNCPNGIDVDENGNAYVANFSNGQVIKVDPNGVASSFVSIGSNNGHLLIRDNFIYVVDRGGNRIFKVSFTGGVSVFAGTGGRGLRNGTLDQATFSLPNDIAFSPDGTKMYVNDVANISGSAQTIAPVTVRVLDLVN